MLSVVVIGTGNVARQLCLAWQDSDSVEVVQIIGRSIPKEPVFEGHLINLMKDLSHDADCYIIAVSDSSILTVNQHITVFDKLVVHTAGSISIDTLKPHVRRGVFYPLQTFSAGREVDFSTVPVFLETSEDGDKKILQQMADSLSGRSHWLDSDKRRQLHLAAVYLNNFTNHLLFLSGEQCRPLGINPSMLHPLLQETVAKAMALGPYKAQTGPARRGDNAVIQEHMELIEDPMQQEIYKVISQSIQSTYGNELQKHA